MSRGKIQNEQEKRGKVNSIYTAARKKRKYRANNKVKTIIFVESATRSKLLYRENAAGNFCVPTNSVSGQIGEMFGLPIDFV